MADPTKPVTPAATTSTGKTGLTDTIRTSFAGEGSLTDKVKSVYKARPVATVALAGVLGIAILNTLRGKR